MIRNIQNGDIEFVGLQELNAFVSVYPREEEIKLLLREMSLRKLFSFRDAVEQIENGNLKAE